MHKTPNSAVDADAEHWAGFWQKPRDQRDAHEVLEKMRNAFKAGLRVEASFDEFDMPPFTSDLLLGSAKGYKKTSKGSDHWLSVEVCLPVPVVDPLAHAIDFSITLMAWPHQNLLNLHPELGKVGGGFRTIAKTPKLYRLWARTRRAPVAKWEAKLVKPYDKAGKGSSALVAAASSSVVAEIAMKMGTKSVEPFLIFRSFLILLSPPPCMSRLLKQASP